MPKKKGPTQISFRLKPAELEPIDADRKALPGVPVARNTYAKHVVLSYPAKIRDLLQERDALGRHLDKLKLIHERVKNALKDEDGMTPRSSAIKEFSRDLLREAGL